MAGGGPGEGQLPVSPSTGCQQVGSRLNLGTVRLTFLDNAIHNGNLKSLKNLIARKGMCRLAEISPERIDFLDCSELWCKVYIPGSALQEAC